MLFRSVKRGCKIKIELGYNGELRTEFEGYVRQVKDAYPVTLQCEDQMSVLKRKKVPAKAFNGCDLETFVSHVAPGYQLRVANLQLGGVIIQAGSTAAQCLEWLKDKYLVSSYFQNEVLCVGLAYELAGNKTISVLNLEMNVAKHSLEYVLAEEEPIKIRAISLQKKGKRNVVDVPDDGLERYSVRTRHFGIGLSKTQLTKLAKAVLKEERYDGIRGTVTGFGVPTLEMGDSFHLESSVFTLNNGTYLIDDVIKEFGGNGYRREYRLGRRVG